MTEWLVSLAGNYLGGHPSSPAGFGQRTVILAATTDEVSIWTHDRRERLAAWPMVDVASFDIEQLMPDHARGWSLATGFLFSGRRVPATSAIEFKLRDGSVAVFATHQPVPAARAAMSGVSATLAGRSR